MASKKTLIGIHGLATAALGMALFFHSSAAQAQCSTAAWSGTSGSVQAIGVGTSPMGRKYEQNCGLTVEASAGPAFVTTTAPTNETFFATRFYVYPTLLTLPSGDAQLFKARNGGTDQVVIAVRRNGDDLELVARYRSSGSLQEHGTAIPLLPTWQGINVTWEAGAGNGTLNVKLDGEEVIALNNLSNGSEVVNEMDLGLMAATAGGGSVVFDAFETRRALPEPSLLTINSQFSISTRAPVGEGRLSMPAGFIIDGDTEKCVVVRGRGKSVNLSNVDKLQDPNLTLVRLPGPEQIAFNDDWQDDPVNAAIISDLGRQPGDPSDSAIFACLQPGNYTATLRGDAGAGLGVGIVEVVDADKGTPFLFSISTRAETRPGRERIVAGFIVQGTEPKQVLIRGRGPSINLPNVTLLDDPILELLQGPNSLAINDDWQDAANAADVAATGSAPTNPKDSAILITLQPGSYTARLDSALGSSGVGIVEVIDLDGGSIEAN